MLNLKDDRLTLFVWISIWMAKLVMLVFGVILIVSAIVRKDYDMILVGGAMILATIPFMLNKS